MCFRTVSYIALSTVDSHCSTEPRARTFLLSQRNVEPGSRSDETHDVARHKMTHEANAVIQPRLRSTRQYLKAGLSLFTNAFSLNHISESWNNLREQWFFGLFGKLVPCAEQFFFFQVLLRHVDHFSFSRYHRVYSWRLLWWRPDVQIFDVGETLDQVRLHARWLATVGKHW